MVHLVFVTKDCSNLIRRELARREICWLVKDRLIPNTPAGRAQAGFSFVRSQVEPTSVEGLANVLLDRFGSSGSTDEIRHNLKKWLGEIEGTVFVVPLREEIELSPLIQRLAFTETILKMSGYPSENGFESFPCARSFWSTPMSDSLVPLQNRTLEDMAMFNIVHPYQEACAANVANGTLADIETGETIKTDSFVQYKSRIASTLAKIDIEGDDVIFPAEEMNEWIERISSWSLQGTEMRSAINNTGALSAGTVLFTIKSEKIGAGENGKSNLEKMVEEVVRIGDSCGLSIHLIIQDYENQKTYLGLKKHPRDKMLDELGPSFDPRHEIRKLLQVEGLRNNQPGYKKGPYGERVFVHKMASGWSLAIARPGFKDCEDFHVTLQDPVGRKVDPYLEKRPNFEIIFEEVRRHLTCPHSGSLWLRTAFHLWFADQEPARVVKDFLSVPQECDCTEHLRYDSEAFLWLIYYLFVEEDINYRFWYHPPLKGLKYRKQGRDMPMNGILRVASNPFNENIPKETNEETRHTGGLVARPKMSEFHGPDYLKATFEAILLEHGKERT